MEERENGDAALRWTRRGRNEADSWLGEDIPLGEEFERYRIDILAPGEVLVRTVETAVPEWTYPSGWIEADFPVRPAAVVVEIRQISASVGGGLPARRSFVLG